MHTVCSLVSASTPGVSIITRKPRILMSHKCKYYISQVRAQHLLAILSSHSPHIPSKGIFPPHSSPQTQSYSCFIFLRGWHCFLVNGEEAFEHEPPHLSPSTNKCLCVYYFLLPCIMRLASDSIHY